MRQLLLPPQDPRPRAVAFRSKLVVLDEPTAARGVRESNQVLQLVPDRGLPVILIRHNMSHVFDMADRIHIQRLGKCSGSVTPQTHTVTADAIAITTDAPPPNPHRNITDLPSVRRLCLRLTDCSMKGLHAQETVQQRSIGHS